MGHRAAGHVLLRNRQFFFRCRIPASLVAKLGRRELVRSLRTGDARLAMALAAGLAFRLPALWRIVSDERAHGAAHLIDLVNRWLRDELDRQWRLFETGAVAETMLTSKTDRERFVESRELVAREANQMLEHLIEDYRDGDYSRAVPVARAMIARSDSSIRDGSREFAELCKRAMEAMAQIAEARERWAGGEVEYVPPSLLGATLADAPQHASQANTKSERADAQPCPATSGASRRLGDAIEVYIDLWKREKRPTQKQLNQERSQLNVVVEVFGADRPVATILPSEAGRIFEALRFLPKRWQAHPELAGLDFFERAEKAKNLQVTPLNPRTINTYLQVFRGLFEAEKRNGQIIANPFVGMRVAVDDDDDDEKGRALDADELEVLFSSAFFQGARSQARPYSPGDVLMADWRFWGAIIALMTGCRVGEIAQLRPEDIKQIEGIWVVDINRHGGRRLKTKTSARKIPVHNRLIDLGLLDLAERRRQAKFATLLPECPKPVQDDAGKPLSRWMSENVLPRLNISDRPGLGFHSLRHSMSTSLRNARISDRTIDRLMGHQSREIGAQYGEFDWEMLQTAINSIVLPEAVQRLKPR